MASVSYKKLHSRPEVCRIARHCDKTMRVQDGHRNKEIDTSRTYLNTQLPSRGYNKVCALFDNALAELDSRPHANKRAGRVVCFSLEVPAPLNIRQEDYKAWFQRVYELICEQYDYRNVLQYYVHYDETHEYVHAETSRNMMSRVHSHCLVVPECDGKLNGKWFSSRANMIKLNNSIHNMTEKEFGLEFMDGSKIGSSKRVEQLKRESEARAYEKHIKEKEAEIEVLLNRLKDLSDGVDHFDEIFALGLEEWRKLHPDS